MINRFNFFDVYGYLIPGLVLLVLLWGPYGIVTQKLPPVDFSSGMMLLVIAYIVGHLLQSLAQRTFKSNVVFQVNGKTVQRHPSDRMLDKGHQTGFSDIVKQHLIEYIEQRFGIPVGEPQDGEVSDEEDKALRKRRDDAFRLCRATLIHDKEAAIYPEQFEGMYWLWRGMLAAFLLAVFYYLAWAGSIFLHCVSAWILLCGVGAAFLLVVVFGVLNFFWWQKEAWWLWLFAVLVFVLGAYCGAAAPLTCKNAVLLVVLSGSFLLFAHLSRRGHQGFAIIFAASVYHHFLALVYREQSKAETKHQR